MTPAQPQSVAPDAVWFITRKHPPAHGGMEILSYELATRMGKRRPTRVVAMKGSRLALPGFLLRAAWRLAVAARKGSIAVVHVGDAVLAPLAHVAHAFGVPAAMTLHGLDVTYTHPLYRAWLRLFLSGPDAYVCISEATRRAALARGVPAARTSVIGIGVDSPPIANPSVPRDDDVLLFVGRLVPRKGLAWFVEHVLPVLAAEREALRLVVVGDGPERRAVVEAATRAGVRERVALQGALDDAQKWAWYARATACIMPNVAIEGDMEGFGIVALEAMAAGCPLVAADVDALRDTVAPARGAHLVRAGDPRAWCKALEAILADRIVREHAADEARAWVASAADWESVVARYDELFTRLATRRGGTDAGDRASERGHPR